MTTVTGYATLQTGGNCMVDIIVLNDGTYLSLTADIIVKWKLMDGVRSVSQAIEQWYDIDGMEESFDESENYVNYKHLDSYGIPNADFKIVKGTIWVHSFPNNKLITFDGVMINLDTLECKTIRNI